MDQIADYLTSFTLRSSSLCFAVLVAVGVAFLVQFVIACINQRRNAARSVAGIPGPPGHWLKGHIDYVSFVFKLYFKNYLCSFLSAG